MLYMSLYQSLISMCSLHIDYMNQRSPHNPPNIDMLLLRYYPSHHWLWNPWDIRYMMLIQSLSYMCLYHITNMYPRRCQYNQ
jgi:hypothetical protein